MHISREDQKSVYRTTSCRVIFRRSVNARLRKPKLIRAVVEHHNLQVWPFSRERLVGILRELLNNRIFESDEIARNTFPELFEPPVSSVPQGESVQNATSVMSVIQKEQAKLLKAIEGLLVSGSYSDLTIISHGKEHRVHQAIVCPQSDFVAKACHFRSQNDGDSSDTPSASAIVDFEEEDPELVDGMIQFWYRSNYDIKTLGEDGDCLKSETSQPYEPPLILHAKMYALAEKYVVEGLKALSLAKFETKCHERRFTPEDLFATAEFVYASTIEADRDMRDAVVKTFYENPEHFDSDAGRRTLQTVHELLYDVLQYVRTQAKKSFRAWP